MELNHNYQNLNVQKFTETNPQRRLTPKVSRTLKTAIIIT
jgi:hypothetical protein